jgi:hypothetical protein
MNLADQLVDWFIGHNLELNQIIILIDKLFSLPPAIHLLELDGFFWYFVSNQQTSSQIFDFLRHLRNIRLEILNRWETFDELSNKFETGLADC